MRLSLRLLRNIHLAIAPILGAFVYASPPLENRAFISILNIS